MASFTAMVQFARAASAAWPLSCVAALAAAQASAVPDARRLALGQDVTANAGAAAISMTTPAVMERQDFKDIRTSKIFSLLAFSQMLGLPQRHKETSELLVCAATCTKSRQFIAPLKNQSTDCYCGSMLKTSPGTKTG
jgi:hypothetical protein